MPKYLDDLHYIIKYKLHIQCTSKSCTLFKIGGFTPKTEITQSWYGKVLVCKDGEEWPISNGKPMTPLCQLNLEKAAHIPSLIKDVIFITIFIDVDYIPLANVKSGVNWCLRTYTKSDILKPINQKTYQSPITPVPIHPLEFIHPDHPTNAYSPFEIHYHLEEIYEMQFQNYNGIKLGGFPSAIHKQKIFTYKNKGKCTCKFMLQINHIKEADWIWKDFSILYFGVNIDKKGNAVWYIDSE